MTQAVQSPISMISALPFFLCLMLYAGIFYIGSLAVVMIEREEFTTVIEQGEAARQDQATLVALSRELLRLQAAFEERRQQLVQWRREKSVLESQWTTRQRQADELARLRQSLVLREAAIAQLRTKIAALTKELAGVQRALGEKEQVQARDLAPAGSQRPAVFMECDAQGVWIMPARRLLAAAAPSSARQAFLGKARTTGYVVFLIRPDGFSAFETYREVLRTYNKWAARSLDFGYEPVDADWKLMYPTER